MHRTQPRLVDFYRLDRGQLGEQLFGLKMGNDRIEPLRPLRMAVACVMQQIVRMIHPACTITRLN